MNFKTFCKNLMLASIILTVFALPLLSNAQTPTPAANTTSDSSYQVLAPLPCVEGGGVTCPGGNGSLQASTTFQTYVQYSFNLLIALAAVAAVAMIVYGGLEYMLSAIPSTKGDGLKKVQNAVIGLILVLGSYLLLRTIDPRFVNISSTLVPKIDLKSRMTTPVTLAEQLQAEADKFETDISKIKNEIALADKKIADIQSQKSSLEYQILALSGSSASDDASADAQIICQGVPTGNTEIDADCLKIANLTNQIDQVKNEQTLTTAKGIIDSVDYACGVTSDPSCFDDKINLIAKKYGNFVGKLQPDQLQELLRYAEFAQTSLEIDQQAALVYAKLPKDDKGAVYLWVMGVAGSVIGKDAATVKKITDQQKASIDQINKIVSDYAKDPKTDKTQLQALKDQQTKTINTINAMYKKGGTGVI